MPKYLWIISVASINSTVPVAWRYDAGDAYALAESFAKEVSPDVTVQGEQGVSKHFTWHYKSAPVVTLVCLVNGEHPYFSEDHLRRNLRIGGS